MQNIIMKPQLMPILIILISVSCDKNQQEQINWNTYMVSDKMKTMIFQPGSYWVYQSDSIQGNDSTFITSVRYSFLEIYKGLNQGERFEYYAMSSKTLSPTGTSLNLFYIETLHMLLNPALGYPYAEGPLLFTLDTADDWHAFSGQYRSTCSYIDSMKVNNKTFYNIQKCICYQPDSNLHYHNSIYFTTITDGIIEKMLYSGNQYKTWKLLRYRLVK